MRKHDNVEGRVTKVPGSDKKLDRCSAASGRSLMAGRRGKRLSLKDLDPSLASNPRTDISESSIATRPQILHHENGTRGWGRSRRPVSGSMHNHVQPRRRSLTILSNRLRSLEAGLTGVEEKFRESWRMALDCSICLGITAAGAILALLLFIVQVCRSDDDYGVRVMQWILATAFATELGLRLYASGPCYCACWVSLCDAGVVVAGVCLTYATSWGSVVLSLRMVRVCILWHQVLVKNRREPECDEAPEAPVVQLYQFMLRVVKNPCTVFTASEKKELCNLMSLLAHQQIYVSPRMSKSGEDYWTEYEPEEKPRERNSILNADSRPSVPLSPTGKRMLGLAMKYASPDVVMSLGQDAEVERVLAKVDDWDFDPFELDTVTQGHPMVTLGAYLFEAKYNFFSSFGLSKPHFNTFMVEIEAGYGSGYGDAVTNVYHNRRHAADVTQAVHYFMQVCSLGQLLEDVEAMGLILGALVHDFKHRGRSNAFLIKTNAQLALVYNDVSVLENYHLSEAFQLLRKGCCNFLRDVAASRVQEIRQIIISMVLATDLKKHFEVLGEFESHLADVQEGSLIDERKSRTYASAMKVCIKSADVSHVARATMLHLRWTQNIIEEFFGQGDEERLLGLELSPLCDRHTTGIASSQKSFINFIVKPLFKSWVSFLDCPAADLCSANIEVNEAMWTAKETAGDESLDFMAVPPPPPPTLKLNPMCHRASQARGVSRSGSPGLAAALGVATASRVGGDTGERNAEKEQANAIDVAGRVVNTGAIKCDEIGGINVRPCDR